MENSNCISELNKIEQVLTEVKTELLKDVNNNYLTKKFTDLCIEKSIFKSKNNLQEFKFLDGSKSEQMYLVEIFKEELVWKLSTSKFSMPREQVNYLFGKLNPTFYSEVNSKGEVLWTKLKESDKELIEHSL